MERFKRSLDYVKVLRRAIRDKRRLRKKNIRVETLLPTFPPYVADDIAEIIYNILLGNVSISASQMARLRRNRAGLISIARDWKKKKSLRRTIYKQSGKGLFAVLIPILASVIGSVVSNAI